MTDNKILYEIVASNGQVLEHGFTSEKKALTRIKEYKKTYQQENFSIRSYEQGKYGNE